MKRIGLDEVHDCLLGIAKEFDRVCTACGIPYYMAYGTMLGAIRHGGFIPWDDDMDFVVPIEYYQQLIKCLEVNLAYPYKCRSYKNSKAVIHCFIKIEDQRTIADNATIDLPTEEKIGINIDVFPLNRYEKLDGRIKMVQRMIHLLGAAFSISKDHNTFFNKCSKRVLRCLFMGKPIVLQRLIDHFSYSLNKGDRQGSIFDNPGVEPLPSSWYGDGTRYRFEDSTFIGPVCYDGYLRHMYGDYMTPPAVQKRNPHADCFYLK